MEKRLVLKLGPLCNNNCVFCYQSKKRKVGSYDLEEIKRKISNIKKNFQKVILTGGEPTIHKDVFEIIAYLKEIKIADKIYLQTNARILSNDVFFKKTIKLGVMGFLVSFCGPNIKVHDSITRTSGSFSQTLRGINNIKKARKDLLINVTVVNDNLKHLKEIAILLSKFKPNQLQFSLAYPEGNALNNYGAVIPSLHKTKNHLYKAISYCLNKKINIKTELFPFCIMHGLENCCAELSEPDLFILEGNRLVDYKKQILKKMVKSKKCKICKYYDSCFGIPKPYAERKGFIEINPIK